MSTAAIFIYGCVVFAIVVLALGLIAWGIVQERRDRHELELEQADPKRLERVQAGRARAAEAELRA